MKKECPICNLPRAWEAFDGLFDNIVIQSCCGQRICRGCDFGCHVATERKNVLRATRNELPLPHVCAFCRTELPRSYEEAAARCQKRALLGCTEAMMATGVLHYAGIDNVPKSRLRAFDYYCRAAEMGNDYAYNVLASWYVLDIDLADQDRTKMILFFQVAAKKGCIVSCHNLGVIEQSNGNHNNAVQHFTISASAGCQQSLKQLRQYLEKGHLNRQEYAKILDKFLSSQAELKSDVRDELAKSKAVQKNNILMKSWAKLPGVPNPAESVHFYMVLSTVLN